MLYEYDYFHGHSVSIWLGDILIDEAVGISFSVDQQFIPLYGYSDQYYKTLAAGKVIASGTLVTNFKESGYLQIAFNEYLSKYKNPTTSWGADNKILPVEELYQIVRSPASVRAKGAWDILETMNDSEFERVAKVFEDYARDADMQKIYEGHLTNNKSYSDFSGTSEQNVYTIPRRMDQFPAVDILIGYGDVTNDAANHSFKRIVQATISHTSQVIQASGEPILEVYKFIAKSVT